MSEELAWAAGLFDGEGSIFASGHMRASGRRAVRLHMALGMTTEESVRRFARVVGVGSVVYHPNQPRNRKPQWRWQATANGDVRAAFERIRPWLSPHKLEQAAEAIAARDEYEATPKPPRRRKRLCIRGHVLSETLYVAPGGGRYCRLCQKERMRAWHKKRRDDAPLMNYVLEQEHS